MVSERIFGKTGAPARRVTELKDVRPGDIIYSVSGDGKSAGHIGIVYEIRRDNSGNTTGYKVCDGNILIGNNPGVVKWFYDGENGWERMGPYDWIFTRYPA